jgi:hypothetical protein
MKGVNICDFCSNTGTIQKFFICPSSVFRPNMYTVCDKHQDKELKYEDVYPKKGCAPITQHEYNV